MKKIIVYYLCLAISLFGIYYAINGAMNNRPGNFVFATILLIIAALWAITSFKKFRKEEIEKARKEKALEKRREEEKIEARKKEVERAMANLYQYLSFRVAGTTFKNDDGTSRQDILKHIKFRDPPYIKEDDKIIAEIKETEYNNATAFSVFVNGYQIGFVPKGSIPEIEEAFEHDEFNITAVDVIGGGNKENGEKLSYGCEITARYRK